MQTRTFYRQLQPEERMTIAVPAPTDEALQAVLQTVITRMMKLLTRRGVLVEEQGRPTWPTTTATRTRRARSGRCRPRPVLTASPSARAPGRRC